MNRPKFTLKRNHLKVRRLPNEDSLAETAYRISASKRAGERRADETDRAAERPDEQTASAAQNEEKA
jgi:hypothetical protein